MRNFRSLQPFTTMLPPLRSSCLMVATETMCQCVRVYVEHDIVMLWQTLNLERNIFVWRPHRKAVNFCSHRMGVVPVPHRPVHVANIIQSTWPGIQTLHYTTRVRAATVGMNN